MGLRGIGLILSLLLWVGCTSPAPHAVSTQDNPPLRLPIEVTDQTQAVGNHWAVSTQGSVTTKIGADILESGGNAIDAWVATTAASAVERPHSTSLAGTGFLLYYHAKKKRFYFYDFLVQAPAQASTDMFLDSQKNTVPGASVTGVMSVASMGVVRAMHEVHHEHGKMKWAKLLEPARKLAIQGFDVYPSLAKEINEQAANLKKLNRAEDVAPFFKNDLPRGVGDRIIQLDAANTLQQLQHVPDSMNSGALAKKIVAHVGQAGGILSFDDLNRYQVKKRTPLVANVGGYQVVTAPPPSSGGTHIIQLLKALKKRPEIQKENLLSAKSINVFAQLLQQVYFDRAKYMGDPDFISVPVDQLITDQHIDEFLSKIEEDHAVKSVSAEHLLKDHFETTHVTLVDAEGNIAVSTHSVNTSFGSKMMVPGTGLFLINGMDDFSVKPGALNAYGAFGSEQNKILPRKRPLSSMSPTIVMKDGRPVLALGSPGGTRIITALAQVIHRNVFLKMPLMDAVLAPRIHHQWIPDLLVLESLPALNEVEASLKQMGYTTKMLTSPQSRVMAISMKYPKPNQVEYTAVADPRDIGTAAAK